MKISTNLQFIKDLHKRLQADNGLLQVLLGPRQVGKTTTVLDYLERQFSGAYHYVSADQELHTGDAWIRQHWDLALHKDYLLVIDEIQKCENWSETIKSLWDTAKKNKKRVRCVLLGSSSLKIQKGLTESLTGRFQLTYAHHWNVRESQDGFGIDFETFLKFGGYPGSYRFLEAQEEWRAYVTLSIIATVIEKDILQFHTVRSPALFKQAYEIISAYPAMEVSYNKLLGQLQSRGNVELIKHYLELYQGAFLIRTLEKFSDNTIRIKGSSPKIIPLAPCLYYVNHLGEYDHDERGHVFEAMVGAQLVRTGEALYYWREGHLEVDFVVKRGRNLWAIEVKSGRRKRVEGVNAFKKRHPTSKSVIITPDTYLEFETDPVQFLTDHAV
jgi:predicted AAA+ superfamily ATPase